MNPPDPEAPIAALLAEGALDEAATAIVRGYGPGILGYLAALLGDDDDARDAFSAFGEELWRALPRYEGRSRVRTWAYAIAYHCALRARRAEARRRTRPLRTSEVSGLAAGIVSTARSFSRTEADRRLDALRRALTDEERTLLVLRIDRRMAWDEIAEVVGVDSVPVLRKRFQRLKARLRRLAEREGLVAPPEP